MIDEIFDRTYQDGRAQLNAGIGIALRNLGAGIRQAFEVLNRIEYQSPWSEPAGKRRCS